MRQVLKSVVHVVLLLVVLLVGAAAYGIPNSRVMQIQHALIQQGYHVRLTGRMDKSTVAALKDFQKKHGWQRRIVPDARALQELGLGPKYHNLLNYKTAWLAKGSSYTIPKKEVAYVKRAEVASANYCIYVGLY